MKWTIIILAIALSLNGCADTADAETSSMATTSKESNNDSTTTTSSGDTVWAAIIMTWNPVVYTIDKEFTSEVDCWNYYDTGVGESKMLNSYGTQVLDHQGNKPDKDYMKKHRPPHRVYPTRMYKNFEGWTMWLTCDIKQ
ncbi:uncharacterized protein METZ01_LOCUS65589 [marine metagenome]|uniref:Uncharacterized protein n=1 Tax=marine metagenome TaxID=408172 RepID=A0A381T985_9ZZZZ